MKRRSRAHSVRYGRCRPHHERTAHAVALSADLPGAIDWALRVEPRDKGRGVLFDGAVGMDRLHQRCQLGAVSLKLMFDASSPTTGDLATR